MGAWKNPGGAWEVLWIFQIARVCWEENFVHHRIQHREEFKFPACFVRVTFKFQSRFVRVKRFLFVFIASFLNYFRTVSFPFYAWKVLLDEFKSHRWIGSLFDVKLQRMEMIVVWCLALEALKLLLPFGSSYLCEQGFSTLTEMKSKKRERLAIIDEEMRVSLSTAEPRLNMICSRKEAQISH